MKEFLTNFNKQFYIGYQTELEIRFRLLNVVKLEVSSRLLELSEGCLNTFGGKDLHRVLDENIKTLHRPPKVVKRERNCSLLELSAEGIYKF